MTVKNNESDNDDDKGRENSGRGNSATSATTPSPISN